MVESSSTKSFSLEVYVRMKPFDTERIDKNENSLVDKSLWDNGQVTVKFDNKKTKLGPFTGIVSQDQTQDQVYYDIAQPMVDQLKAGYNCTLFAYGQTASGKTHTLIGPPEFLKGNQDQYGICPKIMIQLLAEMDGQNGSSLQVQVAELYGGDLYDLLNKKQRLRISGSVKAVAADLASNITNFTKDGKWVSPVTSDGKQKSSYDDYGNDGQTVMDVKNIDDVCKVMELIMSTRQAKSHALNERSSRSFCIIVLTYQQTHNNRVKKSKFNIIDLAGSERIKKSEVSGMASQEAVGINTALSALGRCIEMIAKKKPHIPYRDSPLTVIMKDSLTGNCKTTLIVTTSQDPSMMYETLSSLRFGAVCGNVKTLGKVKSVSLTDQIAKCQKALDIANLQLRGMEERGLQGGFDPTTPKSLQETFTENWRNFRKEESQVEILGRKLQQQFESKAAEQDLRQKKKYHESQMENLRGILLRQLTTKIWTEPKEVYLTKLREITFLSQEMARLQGKEYVAPKKHKDFIDIKFDDMFLAYKNNGGVC